MGTEFDLLIDGFGHDRIANQLWLKYLDDKGLDAPDRKIFQHILAASDAWLQRIEGKSPTAPPIFDITQAKMDELHDGWVQALKKGENPVISYTRFTGEPGRQTLTQIAHHVVDHGTYHRGELRGLCRARSEEDFPETGIIGYYMHFKPAS